MVKPLECSNAVRCYLMRKGHIESVEMLDVGSDAELIAQGKAHFARRGGFDGFEVWDGKRRIYVYPEDPRTLLSKDT